MKRKIALILSVIMVFSISMTTFAFASSSPTKIIYASSNLSGTKGAKSIPSIQGEAQMVDKFQLYEATTKEGTYKLVKTINAEDAYGDTKYFTYHGTKTSGMHFFKARSITGNEQGEFSDPVAVYSCAGKYVSKKKDSKTGKYIYKYQINNTGKSTLKMTVKAGKRYDYNTREAVNVDMLNKNGKKINKVTISKNSKKYLYLRDVKMSNKNIYGCFLVDINYKGEVQHFTIGLYKNSFYMNNYNYGT